MTVRGHIILPNGCVVGYRVDKGIIRRVCLGYAMACVIDDDSVIEGELRH
jgi:hypothetical protein